MSATFPNVDFDYQWFIGTPGQSRPAASGFPQKAVFVRRDSNGLIKDLAICVIESGVRKWRVFDGVKDWDAGPEVSIPPTPQTQEGVTIPKFVYFATDTKVLWVWYSNTWIAFPSGGGPTGSVLVGKHNISPSYIQVADPQVGDEPTASVNPSAGNLNGAYQYAVTFVGDYGETAIGPASATINPVNERADLADLAIGPAGTQSRYVYRRKDPGGGFGNWEWVADLGDNVTTSLIDDLPDGSVGGQPPIANDTAPHSGTVDWTAHVSGKFLIDGVAFDSDVNEYLGISSLSRQPDLSDFPPERVTDGMANSYVVYHSATTEAGQVIGGKITGPGDAGLRLRLTVDGTVTYIPSSSTFSFNVWIPGFTYTNNFEIAFMRDDVFAADFESYIRKRVFPS